jgi:hypothetical protein
MSDQNQIDLLSNWINAFDHHLLQNEDDVETKFVIPFFQYLGYPDKCRRGKYPLKTYTPGKSGRKPEIDQVYFSVEKPDEQNADTSLVIIEAKEPHIVDLEDAVIQALFYSHHLTPLLVMVTNAYQTRIVKRHRFKTDEVIFDGTIDELKDGLQLANIFRQLNFETVKRLKEAATSEMTHKQYALLERSLQRQPDLQGVLQQGDFQSSTSRVGNRLTIVRPKVAVVCDLPLAFDEGSCLIEFSNVTLHGLTVHLTHQNILGDLMMGLNTDPRWRTRRFIQQMDDGTFEAQLGQSAIRLSETEVYDLCACIDEMCEEYKNIIVEAENILETWECEQIQVEDIKGFYIVSIQQWLWELMKKFADEFDYGNGDSEWHIFERQNISIRIVKRRPLDDHAFVWPKVEINLGSLLPADRVELLYEVPTWHLESIERVHKTSWKHTVGLHGTWTVNQTKKWIMEKFIPKVCGYYANDYKRHQFDTETIVDIHHRRDYIPFQEIIEPKHLEMYVEEISTWSMHRHVKLAAELLKPYYKALTDLIHGADPITVDISYCTEKLAYIDRHFSGAPFSSKSDKVFFGSKWTYGDILNSLKYHVTRMQRSETEESSYTDNISRVFLAILRKGIVHFSQAQLNLAKQALLPLLEQSRFEMRYVFPNRSLVFKHETSNL